MGNVLNVSGLARILGYRVSSLPMKDLGLLLGASSMAKFIWDTLIENMERILARRKRVYLAKSGRETSGQVTLLRPHSPTFPHISFPSSLSQLVLLIG